MANPNIAPEVHSIGTKNSSSYYLFVRQKGEQTAPPRIIAPGYTADAEHYLDLASEFAERGVPTAIVQFTRHPGFSDARHPNRCRREMVKRTIDDMRHQLSFDEVDVTGHSFGGANIAKISEEIDHVVRRMDFVSSVGFGKAPMWGAVMLGNVFHEASHFLHHASEDTRLYAQVVKHLAENPSLAALEVLAIMQLNIEDAVVRAVKRGVSCRVFVAEHDTLIPAASSAQAAREVVGEENVHYINHPDADHLALQRHPKEVAEQLTT